jgi:serine/threonine protein kinase
VNVAAEWLRSGETASLDGIELIPLAYPEFSNVPISLSRGQATAFVLEDRQNRGWILKKFLPGHEPEITYIGAIRSLVPYEAGFESGSQRRILTSHAVGPGFGTPEFAQWIQQTILMPRVRGIDWLSLADSIRDGTITLGKDVRAAICRSLVSRVRALEDAGLSHRDLSITNVFIDPGTWQVHLIDWDALYHYSLVLPRNTTVGTPGYTAPFVMTSTGEDAYESWCPHADRFAMALLCTEFLMIDRGSEFTHDGGLFEQRDLYARRGPTVRKVLLDLMLRYPGIRRLVERALMAETFSACPSPDEWLAAPPLATVIPAPNPDRQSVMSRFDWYMQKLKEPRPPAPSAPPLPVIDFSAVIRNMLAPCPPTPPLPSGADSEEKED